MPSANTSLRRSDGELPVHCSGDMYEALPFSAPACVTSCVFTAAFAMPKSTTFTWPS
jgi:hypothetical protein